MKIILGVLAVVSLGFGLTATSLAVTYTTDENASGYTVSNSDLLQKSLSSTTATGTFAREGEAGYTALVDGGFGNLGGQSGQSGVSLAAATADSSNTLVYRLNTTYNANGYNLSSITTYAGWDTARYQQAYDVYVHYVGSSAEAFSQIASVTYQPGNYSTTDGNGVVTYYTTNCTKVTSTALGSVANGVDQVKFAFQNADPVNGFAGYRELDVFGTAVDTMVANGSFETPALTAGAFQEGTPATGWTLIHVDGAPTTFGGGIVSNGSGYGNPNAVDGTQAGLLKGAGGMQQSITGFEAGKEYSISFYAAGRVMELVVGSGDTNNSNPFQVLLEGSALSFSGSTTVAPVSGVYNHYVTTFMATNSSMTLAFLSTLGSAGGDYSTYIDNVQISMIPEPSMLTLLVASLFGLLAYAWRKR